MNKIQYKNSKTDQLPKFNFKTYTFCKTINFNGDMINKSKFLKKYN